MAGAGQPSLEARVLHFGQGRGGAPPVVVCATSAWNGLGGSAYQTWAFRRAELTAFVESPFRCGNGVRATMAPIRTLDPLAYGARRLRAIVTRLLAPFERLLRTLPARTRIGVGLCLPVRMGAGGLSRSRAQRAALEKHVTAALEALGVEPLVRVETRGHAALSFVLLDAGTAFAQQTLDVVLVGGVDSYHDPDVVVELLEQERLFDGENLDSFIPGEGGAFMLLARRDIARSMRWPILAELRATATGYEPSTPFDELPCTGVGLSRAAIAATELLREARQPLGWWLSDLTPESYRLQELQLAWPRAAAGLMPAESTLDFLPPHLGDLGAATIPTGLAVAIEGMQRGAPAARNCLVTGSSVTADRGAVLIEKV
jgi:3-oxoacyl-[acyl-carrier-protein] synthase-1